MKNIAFLLFFSILIFASDLSAQDRSKDNFVSGQLMVQTKPNANIQKIVNDLQSFERQPTRLKVEKLLSKHMRIWLVSFDGEHMNHQAMLDALHFHEDVSVAQSNHYVDMRTTTPNDPQYPQQWQYDNTGQSGGTIGVDIDADSAWDISTGGLTALGDTIVICIIDGGIDLNHDDLTPNRWINYAEIPNNNIDDDNNGYIDDYLGWNPTTSSDNIAGNSHGTAIAGIIGAKGNNNLGVSGINWDVKLMIIKGGTGVESEVIESYTYPLEMRKRYNESNGTEGAFVVATNASWGLNGGQPANVPLWCAMYDTLGKYGILNVGAGPNLNVNVDNFGDLPTGCTSEYLIGVTNMNHLDNKVTLAGYGSTHIDLGAFGDGTWTTTKNGYTSFGGTSGATPHVTGSVGLLYATPCPSLALLAKRSPDAAATFARNAILNSVDPNASIANITSTGGRLNLFKAMNYVLDSCTGTCLPPLGVTISNISDTSATIGWTSGIDTTTTFNLRYRLVGDTAWTNITDTLLNVTLTGLLGCRKYEFYVGTFCDTTNLYTRLYRFDTEGCCVIPSGFVSTLLNDTTVNLSWESVYAANQYIIRYKEANTNTWTYDSTITLPFLIENLNFCSGYEYQVQTVCDTGRTAFSDLLIFSSGCANCTQQNYCNASGDGQFEFIDKVTIHTFTSSTGNNDGKYEHSGLATKLGKSTYNISVTPGFINSAFGENMRAWIDYNQDGDFDDPGEQILEGINTAITVTDTFTVPDTALIGITRLRVALDFDALPTACRTNLEGEVEDYCIEITSGIPCDPPLMIDTTSTSISSIDLNWSSQSKDSLYIVRYRKQYSTNWVYLTTSTPNIQLSNLPHCMNHEVAVRVICKENLSSTYSSNVIFRPRCISNTTIAKANALNFNVYPNPFSDLLNIEVTLNQSQDVQVQILSITGQVIQNHLFGKLSGEQLLTIPTHKIQNSGIYIIKMITEDGTVVKRVVK